MKIKRYVEDDMRQAMRRVREELGPDAVILSNSRSMGRTEIVAAIDYDEKLLNKKADEAAAKQPASPVKTATAASGGKRESVAKVSSFEESSARESSSPLDDALAQSIKEPSLADLQHELANLRNLFEEQLSNIVLQEAGRRDPSRMELSKRLDALGISKELEPAGFESDAGTESNDAQRQYRRQLA